MTKKNNSPTSETPVERKFSGERLQVAREFRGLTQDQLAAKVFASDTLISLCEKGRKTDPTPDLIAACGEVLGFRPHFFYTPLSDLFKESECSFRHKRTAPVRLKDQIRAHGTLLGIVIAQLRKVLRFPALNVPHFPIERHEEVEQAAERTRRFWGVNSDGPIHQIGRLLEHAGVLIVSHVVESTKVDAFSRNGGTSIIFLNQAIRSTSRWNYDIAHECGHLVMHKNVLTGSIETETQADRFASALLLPPGAFCREFRAASFSWDHIFRLKQRWKVSAGAIVRRAYDLGLIDAVSYRQAYKYMSFKRWTKGEPHEPEFQNPELLESALNALGSKVQLDLPSLCEQIGFIPGTFADVTGVAVPRSRMRQNAGVIQFPSRSA